MAMQGILAQHIGLQREDEDGEFIASFNDGKGVDSRIFTFDSPESVCLRFIDPYGDNIFNQLQIPELIKELQELKNKLSDSDFHSNIDRMTDFLKESEEVHVHVRFIGD